ncbi:MAG: peptidylprolyl isomerase [Desulfobacteraceae bacterium]
MHCRTDIKRSVKAALAVCAVLIWICMGSARAELVDRVLVVVNDDIILLSELEQVMATIKASYEHQGVSIAEQMQLLNEQRPKVLEKLIRDKLTDQQVARHKLTVNNEEVEATIKRIRDANNLTEAEFRHAVELDGMDFKTYRKQIKDQILRSRLLNREVKSRIVITDTDIKRYYDAHSEQYAGSTKYDLRHILLKFSSAGDALQKTNADEKIKEIQKRLDEGEPFDKLAQQYSDAPTAASGGRLGVFGTHLLTDEIRDAVKGLQPKQYSAAVETDQGYQIFYVENIIYTGGKTLEEATPEIRDKLYAEGVDKKFKKWLEDLREQAHVQILE